MGRVAIVPYTIMMGLILEYLRRKGKVRRFRVYRNMIAVEYDEITEEDIKEAVEKTIPPYLRKYANIIAKNIFEKFR